MFSVGLGLLLVDWISIWKENIGTELEEQEQNGILCLPPNTSKQWSPSELYDEHFAFTFQIIYNPKQYDCNVESYKQGGSGKPS